MPDDEGRLIQLAQGGSAAACAALYDRHYDAVYRYCYFRLGDEGAAQDLAGEVFTDTGRTYLLRRLAEEGIGPINDIIQALGGPMVKWLTSTKLALPTLIIVDTWEWVPFMMIVLLAGLQALPPEVFESARVDGANSWQTFQHITFPMLLPVSITVIVIRGLEAFKLFDIVMVMTGGGPGTSTETVTMYAYQVSMKNGNLGYGSAIAYALLIMITIFTMIFLNSMRRRAASAE